MPDPTSPRGTDAPNDAETARTKVAPETDEQRADGTVEAEVTEEASAAPDLPLQHDDRKSVVL